MLGIKYVVLLVTVVTLFKIFLSVNNGKKIEHVTKKCNSVTVLQKKCNSKISLV